MTSEITDHWIQTSSGRKFHIVNVSDNVVTVEDIAHPLSLQCRYGGHCERFYSVAEHSVHVCDFVMRETADEDLATAALMHDCAEAFLVDLPRPIKVLLADYKALEQKIEAFLSDRFDLLYPWPEIVKIADSRILNDEKLALLKPGLEWTLPPGCSEPIGVKIECWSPPRAKHEFLLRANALQVV